MEKISKSGFSNLISILLKKKYLYKLSIVVAIDLVSTFACASSQLDLTNPPSGLEQPQPSLTVQGDLNNGFTAAEGNFLIPIAADFNRVLYTGLEAQYSANQSGSLLGLGMGYRQVVGKEQVLGGYLFMSRNLTPTKHELWVANPGVERLGEMWDFRANGYIPIGSRNLVNAEGYGADIGDYDYVNFHGHQEFDRWIKDTENAGIGGDAEAGYHVSEVKGLSLYAGPYYYHLSNTYDLVGGAARVKYDLSNHFSFLVIDSYDNQNKNIFTLALRATIGGNDDKDRGIAGRLSDSVEHYVASRGQGTATPIIKKREVSSAASLSEDGVWFFEPGGPNGHSKALAEDGTYEHPYSYVNQTTLDTVYAQQTNAKLYVKTGTYNIGGQLTIKNGMSIYGRSSDYTRPMLGDARPLFQGGLDLQGNNTIDSIRLLNNAGAQTYGINVNGTAGAHIANIVLNNINVGAGNANDGYVTGLYLNYADNVLLKNSSVSAYRQNSPGYYAAGIDTANSNLTLDNSSVTATYSATQSFSASSGAYGIYVSGGKLNVTNGSNVMASVSTSAAAVTPSGEATPTLLSSFGIFGTAGSTTVVDNSNISAVASASANAPIYSYGISMSNKSNVTLQGAKPSVTASSTATADDNSSLIASGIDADTQSTVTMKSGAVKATVSSEGGSTLLSYGIKLSNSTANISGGTIEGSSASYQATAVGLYIDTGSVLNISNTTITASGNDSARGIYANASTVTANSNKFNITSMGANLFSGLGYGIQAVNSTLTQKNNTFSRRSLTGENVKQ